MVWARIAVTLALLLAVTARPIISQNDINGGRGLKQFEVPEQVNTLNNVLRTSSAISRNGNATALAAQNGNYLVNNYFFNLGSSGNNAIGGGGFARGGASSNVQNVGQFLGINAVAEDNFAFGGGNFVRSGVNINVNNVDNGTLAVNASSSRNLGVSQGFDTSTGNQISVNNATPNSFISITSATDGNQAVINDTVAGEKALGTSGSTVNIGDLNLGSGLLVVNIEDQNNVAVQTGAGQSSNAGTSLFVGDVSSDNPIEITANSKNNTAAAPDGANSGVDIVLN
eukprot:TRINITY_DN3517_c0_g3_i1.p1 TRINITY_DN3517_c0_g3~~TRINITY_DN3517_c0_g3_i1.p1  ORF type:complete len:317 (+),score=55.56 TRINITY_DN3517_c0_g3_i1:100-951(+)